MSVSAQATAEEEAELHREEMRRLLFVYAKLNPGIKYVQGMHELLAPIYYLFKTDPDPAMAGLLQRRAVEAFSTMPLARVSRALTPLSKSLTQELFRLTLRTTRQYVSSITWDTWKWDQTETAYS
jgi:hypothetical protein